MSTSNVENLAGWLGHTPAEEATHRRDQQDRAMYGDRLDEPNPWEQDTLIDDPGKYDDLYLPRSGLVDLPRGEPLIDGVLDRHSLFVISGRDQTYKSFLAIDWLACLATGHPWLGHTVERTKVLYIVGEGAWGLNDRVAAWEAAWGEDIEDQWFHIRRAPVNLFRQTEAFLDLLARIEDEKYGVAVFDTLQRMSSGADQNSAKDAGVIIHALDRIKQITTSGAVGIVAHTDKGDNDTRGSSAFEDDADIVWRTKRDEDEQFIRATLTKRKDGPDGLTLELRPRLIDGTGSLVLEESNTLLSAASRQPPKHSFEVLKLLTTPIFDDDGASLTAIGEVLGLAGKGSVSRAMNWLIEMGYAEKVRIRPTSQGELGRLGRYPRFKITSQGTSQLAKLEETNA